MYPLRIVSYNCRSIKNSRLDVSKLCELYDIVILQEHWLPKQELSYLNEIDENFISISSSPVDLSSKLLKGRPYGGLSFLIKKQIYPLIKIVETNSDSFKCIQIKTTIDYISIFNCYLPHYDGGKNLEAYINLLGEINSFIVEINCSNSILMGDFNCHLNTPLFNELVDYCNDNNLILSDVKILGENSSTYTYVSDMSSMTRWLDHIICSQNVYKMIKSIRILHEFILSDHRPIDIVLSIEMHSNLNYYNIDSEKNSHNLDWSTINEDKCRSYKQETLKQFNGIYIPDSIKYLECNDRLVIENNIDYYYNEIMNKLRISGNSVSRNDARNNIKYGQLPGWNDFVKEHHSAARQSYLIWCTHDKPRQGPIHRAMCLTRSRFKLAFRECKRNQDQIINDKIAEKFLEKDSKSFWKEINKLNKHKLNLPDSIESVTGNTNIANFWKNEFKSILTSVKNDSGFEREKNVNDESILVSRNEIAKAINDLKRGKSTGPDSLSAEHYIFAHEIVNVHLAFLFSAIFRYTYLPTKFMDVFIVPLIKNRNGDISSKNNYRPIAISCIISKIFERIILYRCQNCLDVSDNQFAFRKGLSTETCIYVLKQTIFDYTTSTTPVFACFMDPRKAFDRINNNILLKILKERNVPFFILNILAFWFSSQKFYVKWQNILSDFFIPTCGLRQGSLISPLFFNVYLDELSKVLNNSGIGCYMGSKLINHLCYADDTVLLSPSLKSLQKLVEICESFGSKFDILGVTTKIMVCKSS